MIAKTIADKRGTHVALIEPLLIELLDGIDVTRYDLSSLLAISHIGADAAPRAPSTSPRAGRSNFPCPSLRGKRIRCGKRSRRTEYSLDRPELLSSARNSFG